MTYDSRPDTLKHIERVAELLAQVQANLLIRGQEHDASKLVDPELSTFNEYTSKLKTSTYGSDEYKGYLEGMGEGLRHHYENNRHHPEWGERNEEWRPVVGFEGYYEVSNLGDVRSVDRVVPRVDGGRGTVLPKSGQPLTANVTPKGYARIQLSRDTKKSNLLVHRLVADAFLGPAPSEHHQINHRNGHKLDNVLSNLEWATPSDNLQHAYDTGLREGCVKWVVHCVELDLTTFGMQAMMKACHERGYPKVSASGIWGAIDRNRQHVGLTFEGTLLAEWRRDRLSHMNLIDIMELLADWKAATERHDNGDIARSLEIQKERFGINDQVAQILYNTVEYLDWWT